MDSQFRKSGAGNPLLAQVIANQMARKRRLPHRRWLAAPQVALGGGVGAGLGSVQLLAEVAGQIGHHAQPFGHRR